MLQLRFLKIVFEIMSWGVVRPSFYILPIIEFYSQPSHKETTVRHFEISNSSEAMTSPKCVLMILIME